MKFSILENITKYFLFIIPYCSYTIVGNSMLPLFVPKQKLLVQKIWFFCELKKNDVIVLQDPRNNSFILKRIIQIQKNRYFVQGDNPAESTDSRVFGWIEKKTIVGKVMYLA